VGVAAYYAVPHPWVKVLWGVGVGAVAYLVLDAVQAAIVSRTRVGGARTVGLVE
jgi:hypothetical protein